METKVIIDRFEGDKAIILIGESEISAVWPRSFLPEGSREGDILRFAANIDVEATKEARAAVAELLKQLTNKEG